MMLMLSLIAPAINLKHKTAGRKLLFRFLVLYLASLIFNFPAGRGSFPGVH